MCGADANLAATFGAAFSMLPVGVAKEAAKAKELTPVMIDNVREIMNICTRLVMDATSPHLKLEQIYPVKSLPARRRPCWPRRRAVANSSSGCRKYGAGVLKFLTV